jgi:hypothetical protein
MRQPHSCILAPSPLAQALFTPSCEKLRAQRVEQGLLHRDHQSVSTFDVK